MTIKIQPLGLPDKLLALFGKKRAVFMPKQEMPYGYYIATREGFFRALLRSKGQKPPEGWVYWDIDEITSNNSDGDKG